MVSADAGRGPSPDTRGSLIGSHSDPIATVLASRRRSVAQATAAVDGAVNVLIPV